MSVAKAEVSRSCRWEAPTPSTYTKGEAELATQDVALTPCVATGILCCLGQARKVSCLLLEGVARVSCHWLPGLGAWEGRAEAFLALAVTAGSGSTLEMYSGQWGQLWHTPYLSPSVGMIAAVSSSHLTRSFKQGCFPQAAGESSTFGLGQSQFPSPVCLSWPGVSHREEVLQLMGLNPALTLPVLAMALGLSLLIQGGIVLLQIWLACFICPSFLQDQETFIS